MDNVPTKRQRTRVARIQQGLCAQCGSQPPRDGYLICQRCADASRGYERTYLAKPEAALQRKQTATERKLWRISAGLCIRCERPSTTGAQLCGECKTVGNKAVQASLHKLREQVRLAYGGKCMCCGFADPAALCLDHVSGGGSREKRSLGGSNHAVWRKARDEGFPSTYQLLCWNCNSSKGTGRLCKLKHT